MPELKRVPLKKISFIIMIGIILSLTILVCTAVRQESPETEQIVSERKHEWAEKIERSGLPNFFKVSDILYRGAQPTGEGMDELKKIGIKTIINLRSFHSDRDEMGDIGFQYEHIYMKAWHPEDKEVVRFLRIVSDEAKTPAFVHCMHGADRTGTMCAIYRMAFEEWSTQEALDEMINGPFGFHSMWENLKEYLVDLDIEGLKKEAGLE